MSAPNQFSNQVPRARLRQLGKKADALLDAQEAAEENVLVFIHEAKEEGLTNAAIAGLLQAHPTGIPKKAQQGAKIVAERKGRKKADG